MMLFLKFYDDMINLKLLQIDIEYKMKDLIYVLKESLGLPCGIQINEMAFATNEVKLGKNLYICSRKYSGTCRDGSPC